MAEGAGLGGRPNGPIRVLVAEDSNTVRRLLVEMFRSDKAFDVVGEAADGSEAVRRAVALRPDLITMDVHMPTMNGLDATKEIMRQAPTPIMIVSAAAVRGDVELSLSATQAGALIALAKPENPAAPEFPAQCEQLLRMARAMAGVKVVRRWLEGRDDAATLLQQSRKPRLTGAPAREIRLVAIATSTGGPPALRHILSDLPADFPAPIVVVQHISTGFLDGLASWLGSNTALRVTVATDRAPLVEGTVYLAPSEGHLGVTPDRRAVVSATAPIGGFRPSGDFLFQAAARSFGPAALGVILTGMGRDGVDGLAALRAAGGRVLAQDEGTSVVFGMAQEAIRAGVVDEVLPLPLIGLRILDIVGRDDT